MRMVVFTWQSELYARILRCSVNRVRWRVRAVVSVELPLLRCSAPCGRYKLRVLGGPLEPGKLSVTSLVTSLISRDFGVNEFSPFPILSLTIKQTHDQPQK